MFCAEMICDRRRPLVLTSPTMRNESDLFTIAWAKHFAPDAIPSPDPPSELSHYTTAKGLLGICKSNHLWATCARYSNDRSEVTYAQEVLERFKKQLAGLGGFTFQRTLENYVGELDDAYIVSFCAATDLLSQWRGYGKRLGFEIRFSSMALAHKQPSGSEVPLNSPAVSHAYWAKIEYRPKKQKRLLENILNRVSQVTEELGALARKKDIGLLLGLHTGEQITEWIYTIKHPKFAGEQEWRIIAFHKAGSSAAPKGKAQNVEFREGQHGIVPYLEFSPPDKVKLPLVKVVCGPGGHETLTRKSVELLLAQYGFSKCRVTTSKVPLNGA